MVRHEPTMEGPATEDGAPYVYRRAAGQAHNQYHDDSGYDEFDDFGHEPRGLVDSVLAAPGRLAMTVVTLIGFAVVGVNAAYMQPGAHPAPMLATRDAAPAMVLPQDGSRLDQRAITAAPAPIVPPSRTYDATASINQSYAAAPEIAAAPRQPYNAPAPMPRPSLQSVQVVAQNAVSAAPTPRPVETIAVNDPIAALLAPVVQQTVAVSTVPGAIAQPLPPAAATRSAQPVVAAVQSVLAELGYNPGSIDGVIGPSTEEAIRRFQLRRALEPNGQITGDLLREIERVSGTRITMTTVAAG